MRADSPGFRFRSIRATGAYRRFRVSRLYSQAGPDGARDLRVNERRSCLDATLQISLFAKLKLTK
jgi:hypothetical protein